MRLATLLGAATLGILIVAGSAGTAAAGGRGDWIGASHGGITQVGAWHGNRSPGRDWNRGRGNGHRRHWNEHRRSDQRWRGNRWSRNDRWDGPRRGRSHSSRRFYGPYAYNDWGGRPYNNNNAPYYNAPYWGSGSYGGWNGWNGGYRPGCN